MNTYNKYDEVESIDPMYPLRDSTGIYPSAIIVSFDPFVLISKDGTMRWSSTVCLERFRVIGKANAKTIAIVEKRRAKDNASSENFKY